MKPKLPIHPPLNPVFARHETFHPRFGWLKKGFDAAAKDAAIFLSEDAPIRLGVGKNMVRSIRYWCSAFKVLENDRPTEFGDRLLNDNGWDPFLEDPASLWLLHWKLLEPTCTATAWDFTFNIFRPVEFSANDLFDALRNSCQTQGIRIAESSLNKDITCILRMYVEGSSQTGVMEDSIDCPFAELGIIDTAGKARHYNFRVGEKTNLPPEIVTAACLEFASTQGEQKTISISKLCYEIGSPGLVFKLSESALCEAIAQVERSLDRISIFPPQAAKKPPREKTLRLSETGGLIQLSFTDEAIALAGAIVDRYYRAP